MIKKEIDEQVSKILQSEDFEKSKILSNFLRFIVTETLNGNEQSLKEYIIGVNVLKKDSDFNPQIDSIVRIHASRLRKYLKKYYRDLGKSDEIKVTIPKGRYIPVFSKNKKSIELITSDEHKFESKLNSKPLLAVLPIKKFQKNSKVEVLCSVFSHDLSVNLSKFSDTDVISSHSMDFAAENNLSIEEVVSQFALDYLITGGCYLEQNKLILQIELNNVVQNKVIWAESFSFDYTENSDIFNYQEIIKKTVAIVCGHFGEVYRNTLNTHTQTEFNHIHAVYLHKKFHQNFSREAFEEALTAIEIGLSKNPNNALLLAYKAELFLNLISLDEQGDIDCLSLGYELVNKSLDLDRNDQHAYQVLSWANMLRHNKNDFYRSIEKMISINPNNVMYTGSGGFGYVCVGDYETGLNYMSEAINLNPYYAWHLNLGFCFYYIIHKQFDEALYWANLINRPGILWDPLLQISVLGLLNKKEDTTQLKKDLLGLSPNFSKRAKIVIGSFIFDKKLQNKIIEGLILSGMKINK